LKKGLSTILQPLVDIIVPVEHAFISDRQLKPGSYAIVDAAVQDALLSATRAERVISSGGSASNSIACANLIGVPCTYAGLVGDDDYGKLFHADFEAAGISSPNARVKNARTGVCLSLITPDGERTMRTNLGVATDLDHTHIDAESIGASEWLLLEGHLLTAGERNNSALRKGIEVAKERDTKIALNINSEFAALTQRDQVLAHFLPQIDLIIANEPEAMALAQKNDHQTAFAALSSLCPTVIVTCGKEGALIQHNGKHLHIPAYTHNIQVVDSTGAGDAFTGVLLGGLTLGCSIEIAAQGAARLAATVISQAGARLPASAVQLWREATGS
jgi:sugar/nucleoside kinase (ribokinase family)